MTYTVIPIVLTFAGSMAFYLGCEHQRIVARKLPRLPANIAASLCLAIALWLLSRASTPVAAVFTLVTLILAFWSLLPPVAAWLSHRREGGA